MLRFNVDKGDIVIDKESLSLPIFREIYAYDEKKNKRLANNMLYYIYLMSDLRPTNPVRDFEESEKEGEARMASFGKMNYKLDDRGEDLLADGINEYIRHTVTAQERLLEQYDKSIDKSRELMANISEMTKNDEGVYVMNEDYTKFMKDVITSNKIMSNERTALMKVLMDDNGGKMRAGRSVSHIEKSKGGKSLSEYKGK